MAVKLIDELQKEIKAASEAVTQEAYEKAYDHVFQILDNLEKLLNDNRYLEGNEITEEDKRLYDILIRFDAVYYFKQRLNADDIEDGTTDLAIIDVAMYNAYQKEYNYDIVANQISDDDAKAIADNSYAYYIFPKDQEELRDKVDEELKELKKDGTLSKLSQKYFGQDTAPEDDQFEKTPN